MREAIGGTWLFGLVITFIVFFASFLAVSINYSKAFNVKNNVVDLISKYEGNNNCTREKIANYLRDVGYLVTGSCPEEDDSGDCIYKGYDLNGNTVNSSQKAYYWIASDSTEGNSVIDKTFYRVVVFFKLDLPLVGDLTTFKIKGETETVYFPNNGNSLICN